MTRSELEGRTRDFFARWDGHGCDFDGQYGFQCMDEAEQFNQDVVHAPRMYGNAIDAVHNGSKDFYDWIPNTPANMPLTGDVVVWGSAIGQYGHVAVAKGADGSTLEWFDSLDQNWPLGHVCHFVRHDYHGVLGWLRPKTQELPPPPPPAPVPTPVEQPQPEPPAPEPTPEPPKPVDPTPTSQSTQEGVTMPLTTLQSLVAFAKSLWSIITKLWRS